MSDDFQGDLPAAEPSAPEPAAPSTSDIVSNAIEIANTRAADRAAGKPVSEELPSAVPDRARDERGKFAKAAPPPQGNVDATKAPLEPQPAKVEAASAQPDMQINPRWGWSDAQKERFATFPPEAQKEILAARRVSDAEITRDRQEISEYRKHADPILQGLKPHYEYINQLSRQIGQHPGQMIGTLIGFERTLKTGTEEQKATAFASLVKDYRPNLELVNRILGQQAQQPAPAPIPPEVQRKLAELDQFRQQTEAEKQAERDRQETEIVMQRIEAFKTEKDERGQLKHPFYEAVRAGMAPYVRDGMSFEEAYRKVTEPIQAQLQTQTATLKDDDKARAARVALARGATSPRARGTQPGGSMRPTNSSEVVAEAMRSVGYPI